MASKIVEKDIGFKKFFKKLRVLDGHEVVVGIPAKEGEEEYEKGAPLIMIASVHEFGYEDIPQRSFLRDTFDINANKYDKFLRQASKKVAKKGENPKKAYFMLGEIARGDVIKRINQGIDPPLKPATIARKKSSLPLVDTGTLKNSIRAVVRKET